VRVFVTGASGFIGSAVVPELIAAGHQVIGHRGTLDDLDSLRRGAAASDGVIHAAYKHDLAFSGDLRGAAAADLRAIETLGEALMGSDRPLVITTGMSATGLAPERPVTEHDLPDPGAFRKSEQPAASIAERGVRVSVVRLPPLVHGEGDKSGFVPRLIGIARAKGISCYVGDGSNRCSAVHRLDAAHRLRMALEAAPSGSRLHGADDERVPLRDIAEVIGRHLDLAVIAIPLEVARRHFGGLAFFVSLDTPAASAVTRRLVGWQPAHPGLVEDLEQGHYFLESSTRAAA
jgi:nucleoside-diphosphate-sugar epimerase